MADYAIPTIVLSPTGSLGVNASYYSIATEFPLEGQPLQDMQRFVLYPWAYQTNPLLSGRQSPPA